MKYNFEEIIEEALVGKIFVSCGLNYDDGETGWKKAVGKKITDIYIGVSDGGQDGVIYVYFEDCSFEYGWDFMYFGADIVVEDE